MDEKRKRHGGLVGPIILIGFGVLFLLSNLGVLNWGLWETVARLWPLFLVAAGLDVLFGRSSAWVGAVIGLVVVGVIVTAAISPFGWWCGAGRWRTLTTDSIVAPLSGATSAEVVVKPGVGELSIGALAAGSATNLVEGDVCIADGEDVRQDYRVTDAKAYFALQMGRTHDVIVFGNWRGRRTWDLRLARGIPMDLTVATGVGTSNIDLEQIQATDIEIHTGVGSTSVTMPATGSVRASVSGGVGKTSIVVPRGMAARISVKRGLGSVDVDGDYERDGGDYVSPHYYEAKNHIDLSVSSGIGSIDITERR